MLLLGGFCFAPCGGVAIGHIASASPFLGLGESPGLRELDFHSPWFSFQKPPMSSVSRFFFSFTNSGGHLPLKRFSSSFGVAFETYFPW